MKKNKKLLMYFLAINSIFTVNAATKSNAVIKYDKLYSNMIKNLDTGKSNDESYKIIESALNKRNKELKDLYKQSDYIVKPEFLEWQIFFSGFYTEKDRGDNTSENAKYDSDPNYDQKGYYNSAGEYVVTDQGKGKPYAPQQEVKEIDLGMSIPLKVVNINPISITPGAVTAPNSFNVSANIQIPTALPVDNLDLPAFTPTAPVVNQPIIFTPPALDKISTGFGQGSPVGFVPQVNVMIGNASVTPNSGTTTITSLGSSQFSVGGSNFTWVGYNDPIKQATGTQTGQVSTGTYSMNGSSYPYTFLNALAGSYAVSGNWEFKNQTTNTAGSNTTRFASVNHAYGERDKNTVFRIDSAANVDLYGRTDGYMTVGIEYQSYDALAAKVINDGVITLKEGKNLFGITIMIEAYSENNCLYRSSGSTALDTSCGTLVRIPLEESTIENKNRIIINSSESIGIDFAQYVYNPAERPLTIYVAPGNIEINGSKNYGVRVPGVFDTLVNGTEYFKETVIDGSGGTITVGGTENVGISLSKKITGSTLVTGVQGLSASNTSDIIGNIRNLNILVNGAKGVGILRNANFVTTAPQDIVLNTGNVQSIGFGDNATESVLIRTDKYGIVLDRDISVNNTNVVNSSVNNVMLMSNDVNNLGSGLTFVKNNANITIGNNLNNTTGLLSINGGNLINNGTVTVDGTDSQGIFPRDIYFWNCYRT